uniref:Uncharacterized protein n=1 Tax=Manihot esculenta TaxID=3983 RepID=A0A2C9U0R8_MANES
MGLPSSTAFLLCSNVRAQKPSPCVLIPSDSQIKWYLWKSDYLWCIRSILASVI